MSQRRKQRASSASGLASDKVRTLYITVKDSKFPNHITSHHLREHFSEFEADISNTMIIRDQETKKSKGFGFVTFYSHEIAAEAMSKLRGSRLHGKFPLFINFRRSHKDDDESEHTLYVTVWNSKFPNHVNSGHLERHFSDFKEYIVSARIMRDHVTKQTRGFGFVTFSNQAAADLAMKSLRGSILLDKYPLLIKHAQPKVAESRPQHSETKSQSASHKHHIQWLWKDDMKGFTPYSQDIADKLTRTQTLDPNGKCYFRIDMKQYVVDLSTMIQTNRQTLFSREVQCKTVPVVRAVDFHKQKLQQVTKYPREWERQTKTTELFEVRRSSPERSRVEAKFKETMPNGRVISIKRIQNQWLWERYSQNKKRLHEKNAGRVNEMELFHGSRSSRAEMIYGSEEGFDMRFCSAGMWGRANYFAVKASYSDMYAYQLENGNKEILLAKVLTGDSYTCEANSGLRMPPEKPECLASKDKVQLKQVRYDTVNGETNGSQVYMTYSNDKAYPAYLIVYHSHLATSVHAYTVPSCVSS